MSAFENAKFGDRFNIKFASEEEARSFYNSLSKERLIDIIIELTNEILSIPDIPFNSGSYYNCSDWNHCGNPFMDCVNCPLRFGGGGSNGGTFTSTTFGSDYSPR